MLFLLSVVLLSGAWYHALPDTAVLPVDSLIPFRADTTEDAGRLEWARSEYEAVCADCHGETWDGGLAGSLADGEWQYAESDSAVIKVIRNGIEDEGMPAFGGVYTQDELMRFLALIRTQEFEFESK